MTLQRQHYVYLHRRVTDDAVFYVGKGIGRRAWSRCGRNRMWHHIAEKHGWHVHIVRQELSENCALTFERALIYALRNSNILANMTDGGGGTSGWKHSAETKAKIGAFWKGRKLTEKMREALRAHNAGRKFSNEHKAKLSAAKAGKKRGPLSDATRAKIAASHIGIKPNFKSRQKMREAKIGKSVGKNNPTYDHAIRHFIHLDGREFIGTRGNFIKTFSLRDPCVCSLIKGKQKTVKGWKLK